MTSAAPINKLYRRVYLDSTTCKDKVRLDIPLILGCFDKKSYVSLSSPFPVTPPANLHESFDQELIMTTNKSNGLSFYATLQNLCDALFNRAQPSDVNDVPATKPATGTVLRVPAADVVVPTSKIGRAVKHASQVGSFNTSLIYTVEATMIPDQLALNPDNNPPGHRTLFGSGSGDLPAYLGSVAFKKDYVDVPLVQDVLGLPWVLDCVLLVAGGEPKDLVGRDPDTQKVLSFFCDHFSDFDDVDLLLKIMSEFDCVASLRNFSNLNGIVALMSSMIGSVDELDTQLIHEIRNAYGTPDAEMQSMMLNYDSKTVYTGDERKSWCLYGNSLHETTTDKTYHHVTVRKILNALRHPTFANVARFGNKGHNADLEGVLTKMPPETNVPIACHSLQAVFESVSESVALEMVQYFDQNQDSADSLAALICQAANLQVSPIRVLRVAVSPLEHMATASVDAPVFDKIFVSVFESNVNIDTAKIICTSINDSIEMFRDQVWCLNGHRVMVLCVSSADYIHIGTATKLKQSQQRALIADLHRVQQISVLFTENFTLGPCGDLGSKVLIFMLTYGTAFYEKAIEEFKLCLKKFDSNASPYCDTIVSDVLNEI